MTTPETPPLAPTALASRDDRAYFCETCDRYVPQVEVRLMGPEGRVKIATCPTCGRHVIAERAQVSRPLERALLAAVRWPFSREMLPTLVGHVVVLWFFSSFTVAGLALVSLVGLTLGLGVLATYAASVIRATARGLDAPPPPSDLVASWDVLGAVVRHVAVLLVGGLPLLAALAWSALADASPIEQTLAVAVGVVLLCLYVPAGQIVASTRETFTAALDPIAPIRFALRVGGAYLLASALFLATTLAHLVAVGATLLIGGALFGGFSVYWSPAVCAVVVLGVLVEARMLGLVVREHRFDVELM